MIDIPKNQVYAAYDLVGKTLGGISPLQRKVLTH